MKGYPELFSVEATDRSGELCCEEGHLVTCRRAEVSSPALLGSGQPLVMAGQTFTFSNRIPPTGFVYKTAEGDEAVISYNEASGNMFGSLKTHDGKSYGLEKCHLGHVWKEFDVASFGPDESIQRQTILNLHKTVSHETPAQAPREDDNTTMVTYSVMFYFTPQFAAATADIPGFIDQVIGETNQGYRNSRIPVQVSKLCIEAATIDDVGEPTTFLHNFEAMKSSAAALRNTADAAALLAYDFDACGIAFFYTYTSGHSLSVTQKSCALGYFSFGHELGHNFGAQHDPDTATNSVFPHGHGHLIAPLYPGLPGYRSCKRTFAKLSQSRRRPLHTRVSLVDS